MVYKKKLNKRVPVKRLMELYFGEKAPLIRIYKHKNYNGWAQHIPPQNFDEIKNLVANILNISIKKIASCILHEIQGDVNRHNDFLCTVVYLIPLRFTKTCIFYDDDRQVNFEKGFAYRFNDFNYHGIYNPHCAKILLISVETH